MDEPFGTKKTSAQKTRWSQLSDAELVHFDFTSSDPEMSDNISEAPPPVDEEPEVEAMYDMSGRGRKVRCVYCKYPNHFRGIIVRYPNGMGYLVGRDCALNHHGVEFEAKLADFDAAVEKQSYLRRRQSVLNVRAKIHTEFEDLKSHPAIFSFDQLMHDWRYFCKDLAVPLAHIAARGELLSCDVEVRDHAAERARKERLGPNFETERQKAKSAGKRWQLVRNVKEVIGPLNGGLFFGHGTKIQKRFQEIQAEVQACLRALSIENPTLHQIRSALRELSNQSDALEHELNRLDALRVAFESENLNRIAKWGNERFRLQTSTTAKPRFVVKGRSIKDKLNESDTGTVWAQFVSLHEHYHPPKYTLLTTLRHAIATEYEPHSDALSR